MEAERQIKIRIAAEADAAKLLEIYRPYVEQTAITFEYEVPSVEEFAQRIRHVLKQYPYLVAERNGEPVGYAYAGPFKERAAYDWAVETSVYVRQDQRRTGVGKILYEALEKMLARQNILNVNACIAVPETEDAHLSRNSVEFHTHMGYRLVGEFYQCGYKFDTWYNMVWMEKFLGEHPVPPKAVRPFAEFL